MTRLVIIIWTMVKLSWGGHVDKLDARVNQHPPAHHGGRKACGKETLLFCIPVPELITVHRYVPIYLPSSHQVPYLFTYLHSNH